MNFEVILNLIDPCAKIPEHSTFWDYDNIWKILLLFVFGFFTYQVGSYKGGVTKILFWN